MKIYRIDKRNIVLDTGIDVTNAAQQAELEVLYGAGNFALSEVIMDSAFVDEYGECRWRYDSGLADAENVLLRQPSGSIPGAYTDEDPIIAWDRVGGTSGKDFLYSRKKIAILAATTGWNNLTTIQKKIVAKWYAADRDERLSAVANFAEDVENGKRFLQNGRTCRQHRLDVASAEMYARLSYAEAITIPAMKDFAKVTNNYVQYGNEGTVFGDPEGVYDLLNATEGTTWAASGATPGIAAKGWTPYGMTLAQLCVKVISIMQDGE